MGAFVRCDWRVNNDQTRCLRGVNTELSTWKYYFIPPYLESIIPVLHGECKGLTVYTASKGETKLENKTAWSTVCSPHSTSGPSSRKMAGADLVQLV